MLLAGMNAKEKADSFSKKMSPLRSCFWKRDFQTNKLVKYLQMLVSIHESIDKLCCKIDFQGNELVELVKHLQCYVW